MSDHPHPRCAIAGCEMPGEACQDAPCVYVCAGHAARSREERVAAFQEAVRKREEMDRD